MEPMMQLQFKATWRMTVLVLFISSIAAAQLAPKNAAADIDNSIKPGDDFYRYANGVWLKANAIPAGQSSYDNRAMMAERTSQQVRALIQNAASAHASKGSVVQK